MDLAMQLTAHLAASGRPSDADTEVGQLAAGLASLARDLAAEVGSCLSVSIVLSRPAGDLTINMLGPPADAAPLVRASLAVPLETAADRAVLLLQASEAGAFVLLAGDLAGQRDPKGPPLLVDQHLVLVCDRAGGTLAAELADQRVLEQAVGVLVHQGRLPEQARQELHDRARDAQLSAPRLARQLLAALAGPDLVPTRSP